MILYFKSKVGVYIDIRKHYLKGYDYINFYIINITIPLNGCAGLSFIIHNCYSEIHQSIYKSVAISMQMHSGPIRIMHNCIGFKH